MTLYFKNFLEFEVIMKSFFLLVSLSFLIVDSHAAKFDYGTFSTRLTESLKTVQSGEDKKYQLIDQTTFFLSPWKYMGWKRLPLASEINEGDRCYYSGEFLAVTYPRHSSGICHKAIYSHPSNKL